MATIHRGFGEAPETADRDRPGAPVSARLDPTATAPVDRAHGTRISVTVIGATTTGDTQEIDGRTYRIYDYGHNGGTLIIDEEIHVVT